MKNISIRLVGLLAATLVGGCATTEEPPVALEQVRVQYDRLASQPDVQRNAPQRLNAAEQAVNEAEAAWETDKEEELVNHYIYLAERRIAIAEEAAELARAEQTVENAEAERRQVLLSISEAEAQSARTRAEQAEMRARQLEQNLSELQGEMDTLRTEQTNEGIVLTLQDILFNVNQAELASGADPTLDKVAQFLNEYEDRQLEIKGYTDSTGSALYNEGLSEQRAESVKDALVSRGVDPSRISTEGYGENNPVASNDTPAGRQQNRRVEILIQNPQEEESVSGL